MLVEFEVLELNEYYFTSRIEKIQKLAESKGFNFKLEKGDSSYRKIEIEVEGYPQKVKVRFDSYTLDIGIPEESRYIEVGVLRKVDKLNVLDLDYDFERKYKDDFEIPEDVYHLKILCHHCNSGRKCKKTHLLYDTVENSLFQVASGCMTEYAMQMRPTKIEWMLQGLEYNLTNTDYKEISRSRNHYTYEDFSLLAMNSLAHFMSLEELEFVSNSSASHYKIPSTHKLIKERMDKNEEINQQVQEEYSLFTTYLTTCQTEQENKNYSNMIEDNVVPSFRRSQLIFLAYKYLKDQEKREEQARERKLMDAEKSDYLGEHGDKMELDVCFVKSTHFETENWGWMSYHFFVTDEGHILKWSTAKNMPDGVGEGDKLRIKFKVKDHDKYNGLKQTRITYVKILDNELK
ncbi:hypothetical protein COF68_04925 [Bacillus toyonensis]|uniref:hypothetical protein n=1 Tax=Bacillus toyonensis TaxID=155322 RepID=UPI000BFBC3D9|nr:hypothetical protein [Bacillus toyonensis]PHE64192.1 hypothetical protein COF68_04925 [Bacillus toyonensis]